MLEGIYNSSSWPERLGVLGLLADWRLWLMAAAELLLWLALVRAGFRIRDIPGHVICALKRLRGLFRIPD